MLGLKDSQALVQTPVGKRKAISKARGIPPEAAFRASHQRLLSGLPTRGHFQGFPPEAAFRASHQRPLSGLPGTPCFQFKLQIYGHRGMDDDMDSAITYQQGRKDNQAITRYQAYA